MANKSLDLKQPTLLVYYTNNQTNLSTLCLVDEVPPQILGCPANIVDTVNLGVGGKVITWTEPTSSDNSGTSTMTSRTHVPGSFFTIGTTTVTYSFADPSSNSAQCSFTVTIVECKY